jgi:hypothetical protein
MKRIDSSSLQTSSSVTSLQVGAMAELSPAEYGKALLEQAGLTTLEATKNAFITDPGRVVRVECGGDATSFTVTEPSKGFLVVESCADDHRGLVYQTYAGATAQVYAVLSMQDAGTVTLAESTTSATPMLSFQGMSPLGMKSVFMAELPHD